MAGRVSWYRHWESNPVLLIHNETCTTVTLVPAYSSRDGQSRRLFIRSRVSLILGARLSWPELLRTLPVGVCPGSPRGLNPGPSTQKSSSSFAPIDSAISPTLRQVLFLCDLPILITIGDPSGAELRIGSAHVFGLSHFILSLFGVFSS